MLQQGVDVRHKIHHPPATVPARPAVAGASEGDELDALVRARGDQVRANDQRPGRAVDEDQREATGRSRDEVVELATIGERVNLRHGGRSSEY